MKRLRRWHVLAAFMLFSIAAAAQSELFVGTWQIRKSPLTGKVNLTVNIVQTGETLSGAVTFVNPDGTTSQMPIAKPEIKGDTLDFQTLDHDMTMYWSLRVGKNARRGILKASEHEMLIEEKVKKKK